MRDHVSAKTIRIQLGAAPLLDHEARGVVGRT